MLKTNLRETKLFEFSRDINSEELKNDIAMASLCNDRTSLCNGYVAFKKPFCKCL